jgi:hypothetical protein
LLLPAAALQRVFGASPLGNVLRGAEHAERFTGFVKSHTSARMHHPQRAVGTHDTKLALVGLMGAQSAFKSRFEERPVIGMQQLNERRVGGEKFLLFESEDAIELVGPGQGTSRNVPAPTAKMRESLRLLQWRPAHCEVLFGPLTVSDVARNHGKNV